MAQLDANIFLQQQAPDFGKIGEGFERGMRIGDMMKDRKAKDLETQKQATMKEAFNSGYKTNPDGSTSFEAKSVGDFLRSKGMSQDAFKFEQDFQQQQVTNLDNQNKLRSSVFEQTYGDIDFAAKNPGTPQAEKAWQSAFDKAERLGYPMAGMSRIYDVNQVNSISNSMLPLAKQREFEMQKENNAQKRVDTMFDRNLKYGELNQKRIERQDSLALKGLEKEEKKKQVFNEIEDRRQNITAAISTAISKIQEDGTWEMSGPHNQNLDRLIDGIATDMAKLQDPTSVARPSEVEQIKKTLVESGFSNRNSTAQEILKTFQTEIDRRADLAYKVRGYEKPSSSPDINQSTNSIKPTWAK